MPTTDYTKANLFQLSELDDFKVADEDPDVRGWAVVTSEGQNAGRVHELIVDPGARKVRYLDIHVDDRLSTPSDRHVLVPIGLARLDEREDRVLLPAVNATHLRMAPAYSHRPISRDSELTVLRAYGVGSPSAETTSDFYVGEHYDEEVFYEPRRSVRT